MLQRKYNKKLNAWFHDKPDNYETETGIINESYFGFKDYPLADICGRKFGLHLHLKSDRFGGISIFYMDNIVDIAELLKQFDIEKPNQLEGKTIEILKKDHFHVAGFRVPKHQHMVNK